MCHVRVYTTICVRVYIYINIYTWIYLVPMEKGRAAEADREEEAESGGG